MNDIYKATIQYIIVGIDWMVAHTPKVSSKQLLLSALFIVTSLVSWNHQQIFSYHTPTEQEYLQQTLTLWQNKLGMNDWKITIKAVSLPQLVFTVGNFADGASYWDQDNKVAAIYVLQRSAYSDDWKASFKIRNIRRDQENTIVHELLHGVYESGSEEHMVALSANFILPE